MRHEQLTDDIREKAALYALGLLEPEQEMAFRQHLEGGCALCLGELRAFQETAAALPLALRESRPSAALRDRLMDQFRAEPFMRVVRAGQGDWAPTPYPGVSFKPLYTDPARDEVTMLVRMTPGSRYPAHRHKAPEQCLVLEGDLRIGDLTLNAGDYSCAPRGTTHPVVETVAGCLLMIIASRRDEVFA